MTAPLRARSKALFDVLSQEQTKEIAGTPRPSSAAMTTKPARVRGRNRQRGRVVHGRSPPLWSREGHRYSTQSTPSLVG